MRALALLLMLGACVSTSLQATDNAICIELKVPIDSLATTLVAEQEKTPDEVIIKGSTVVRGFDKACE